MTQRISTIQPVSKDSLHRKISSAMVDYIKKNQLKPGDKLPSERALAESFSASRNSVREALRVLENEKIIEIRKGKGAYVAEDPMKSVISVKLWRVNYKELLQIKFLLEQGIVEELCNGKRELKLEELEKPLIQLEKAAKQGLYLQKMDFAFHNQLRHMTANAALEQMINNLVLTLDSYGDVLKGADHIWISTIPYHRMILEGIRERDYEKAANGCKQIYETDLHALNLKEEYNL